MHVEAGPVPKRDVPRIVYVTAVDEAEWTINRRDIQFRLFFHDLDLRDVVSDEIVIRAAQRDAQINEVPSSIDTNCALHYWGETYAVEITSQYPIAHC
jgi:hypothetical protein